MDKKENNRKLIVENNYWNNKLKEKTNNKFNNKGLINAGNVCQSRLLFIVGIISLIVVLSMPVLAIGITPGLTTIHFEPNLEKKIDVTLINSEKEDMQIVVLIEGELNQSIYLEEAYFEMKASEAEKKISYLVKLPASLTPGTHSGQVVVIQLPGKAQRSSAFVGASVGVATLVNVIVPYPGKYAEADLNVFSDNAGKISFVMPVVSRGKLDLVRVKAIIDIYTSLNEKIATISTNELPIESGKREELVATWETNASAGKYKAVATLLYDESSATLEREFSVGNKVLELLQIDVNDFSLGEIAKLELLVENKWGEVISGAFAQMLIYNDEKEVMADIKSPNYDFQPLSKSLMIVFWDTGGVRQGTYDASVFLKFGQESRQQDIKLEVSDNDINVIGLGYVISAEKGKAGGNTLVIVLATIIVVLVIINILWFLVLRKKFSRKAGK